MEIDPDSIIINPELKAIREWTGATRQELAIPELARLIHEDGQNTPATVRETPDGFELVAGHRRWAAIKYLREQGHEDAMLRVFIDPSITNADTAYRVALEENIQRENFTDIEYARQITVIRKKFGWSKGQAGTGNVANFLGVSPATITQKEKLLELPTNIQADVQAGRMSGTAALEVASVQADKQEPVVAKASELAEEEETEKQVKKRLKAEAAAEAKVNKGRSPDPPTKEKAEGGAGNSKVTREPTPDMKKRAAAYRKEIKEAKAKRAEAAKKEGKPEPAPAKVTSKHVRQAAKAVGADTNKAPRMSEATALFETKLADEGQYPPVLVAFAKAFSKWGHGKVGDKALTNAWDDVADELAGLAGKLKAARAKAKASK
jgi:ParB/RepB/Spo0J family partition protein